jgi:hypothetical protein
MKSRYFLPLIVISSTLLGSTALADEDDVGVAITKCFHPTAAYTSVRFGESYTKDGHRALDGRVNFRGAMTGNPYFMKFVMELRSVEGKTEMRVTPGTDTSPFPPNPSCPMRFWSSQD